MVIAAGPFTTSDSLDMDPLSDLVRVVDTETPDILMLVSELWPIHLSGMFINH